MPGVIGREDTCPIRVRASRLCQRSKSYRKKMEMLAVANEREVWYPLETDSGAMKPSGSTHLVQALVLNDDEMPACGDFDHQRDHSRSRDKDP